MSVDRDATTTPAPDGANVRAALRALIDQLLQAVPTLRVVMVRVLRVVMVRVLRVVMVRVLRVVMEIAVTAVTRSVMVLLVVTTAAPVDAGSRSALARVVIALTVRPMNVRALIPRTSPKR